MEKISVIVPVYNDEKYLKRCIESILEQTYKDLEIILIDDGSSDRSPAIIDGYAGGDSRIRVIHQENRGIACVRNLGVEMASGDWIAFVDSDDLINVRMYERLYSVAREYDAEIAMCMAAVYRRGLDVLQSEKVKLLPIEKAEPEVMTGIEALNLLHTEFAHEIIMPPTKLYRADILKRFKYPEGKIHEDEFIAHRLFYGLDRVVFIKERLYNYVRRDSSITGSRNIEKEEHFDRIEAFRDRCRFYHNKKQYEMERKTTYTYLSEMAAFCRLVRKGMVRTEKKEYYIRLFRHEYKRCRRQMNLLKRMAVRLRYRSESLYGFSRRLVLGR